MKGEGPGLNAQPSNKNILQEIQGPKKNPQRVDKLTVSQAISGGKPLFYKGEVPTRTLPF